MTKKIFIVLLFISATIFVGIFQKSFASVGQTLSAEKSVQQLSIDDVLDVIRGACFFASGEGGSLKAIINLFDKTKNSRTNWPKVNLITTNSLSDSDHVFILAMGGSAELEVNGAPAFLASQSPTAMIQTGNEVIKQYLAKKQIVGEKPGKTVSCLSKMEL